MNNRKIALLAIPALAAIMIVGTFAPASAGCFGCVEIDIKPGSDPNSINVNSKGLLPVAIFGSSDFDVTQIDTATVDFDILDVNGSTLATRCNIEDVDGDAIDDMVCFFEIANIEHKCTAEFVLGQIQGQLLDGTSFRGFDEVRWVNCKHFDSDV